MQKIINNSDTKLLFYSILGIRHFIGNWKLDIGNY